MLERYFKSVTKEDDNEYSVEVLRTDDFFTANVYGKFGSLPEIKRSFTSTGLNAEQKVQEWLVKLDEEVRGLVEAQKAIPEVKEAEFTPIEEPAATSAY